MTQEERQVWSERMVQVIHAAFPEVEFANWSSCERCLPHAQACLPLLEGAKSTLPHVVEVLAQLGCYLIERGRYQQAEAPLQQALAWREQHLGPEHSETAQSLNLLARLYVSQGKYAEAEPLYKRALAINEQQLGPTHLATAISLNDLAVLYEYQGKYAEAEPLYEQALAIHEQRLGSQHPHTATSLKRLAGLYVSQGKYAEAEPLSQHALASVKRSWDQSTPTRTSCEGTMCGSCTPWDATPRQSKSRRVEDSADAGQA
jgi:tetratricopeptide (TPR) repeat protein